MTRKTQFKTLKLLSVLVLLPVAACSAVEDMNEGLVPLASWSPAEWEEPPQAEWVNLQHRVAFGSDSMELDSLERKRLAKFLRQSKVTATDEVIVTAPRLDDGTVDPTDLARLDAIRGELTVLGLKVSDDAGESSVAPDSIGITVRRAVAILPDCTQDEIPTMGAAPDARVGCTTSYNLGAMVAFPEDLIEGRGISPADGTKGATSIERYRKDEVKELDEEQTSDL